MADCDWVINDPAFAGTTAKLEILNTKAEPCRLHFSERLEVYFRDANGNNVFENVSKQGRHWDSMQKWSSPPLQKNESIELLVHLARFSDRFSWTTSDGLSRASLKGYPLGAYQLTIYYSNEAQPEEKGVPFWVGRMETMPETINVSYKRPKLDFGVR